ncbi:MAG TPA: transposase [Ktedonobacteraceae bacterium]|jgi:hypothetical protein|nr:transposase [Ktedonobacteraceae bacterium]
MLEPSYDTTVTPELPSPLGSRDEWEQEVLSRLPAGWEEQAYHLEAFQRARELEGPQALLRGLLAYQLGEYSFRQLAIWSVLAGVAEITEGAWRKAMRRAGPWLEWLLSSTLALHTAQSPWLLAKPVRRVVLVDGTHLRCLGKKGETWRIHTALDLLAGRLTELEVTDSSVAEDWSRFHLQAGDVVVSDAVNGYQERISWALSEQINVVVRFSPATLPLYDQQGQRVDVLNWLKAQRARAGRICSQTLWVQAVDGHQHQVRLVALRLTAQQREASQRRKKKKAGKDGRKIRKDTLYLAGWLLVITSLPSEDWSEREILALYRARWHIELLFKRLKQLLKTHRVRCQDRRAIKTSILLFLLSWVLQEEDLVEIRMALQELSLEPEQGEVATACPAPQQGQEHALSEWMLARLSLDLLREQVIGSITAQRVRACLPRLQRFLRGSPRRRTHWYTRLCCWLRHPASEKGGLSYSFC